MGARARGCRRSPALGRRHRLRGSSAARGALNGTGGGRSLLLNGHIDVVPAAREDGWEQDPFDPQLAGGTIVGRGACDMKGGIAAMTIAAEVLAATRALAGDLIVCTNTDEESSGVGGLACARRGVSADFAIVPEPSSLEVWPACRGSVYCTVTVRGRAGHAEQEHPHWRDGGAVNAIDKARFLLEGVDRLRREWRSRLDLRHALLDPPDVLATRVVADAGWQVTIPDRAEVDLSVLLLPAQADSRGGRPTSSVRSSRSCRRGAQPTPGWPSIRRSSAGTPRSTRGRRRPTRRPSRRCSARTGRSGCRPRSAVWGAGTTERCSRSRPAQRR